MNEPELSALLSDAAKGGPITAVILLMWWRLGVKIDKINGRVGRNSRGLSYVLGHLGLKEKDDAA